MMLLDTAGLHFVAAFGFAQGFIVLPSVTLGRLAVAGIVKGWGVGVGITPISSMLTGVVVAFLFVLMHVFLALEVIEFLSEGVDRADAKDWTPRNIWLVGEVGGLATYAFLPRLEKGLFGLFRRRPH